MSTESSAIIIDGSEGEGGGQILRTSLALAAVTGRPLRIVNIRGRRNKPGLLRQHLTAVRAIGAVTAAQLRGAELRSSELEFTPGPVSHGEQVFAVGTAGSATLVFQTVLWPLIVAPGRSRIVFEGGTHNPMAPPFEFLTRVFLPHMRRLGLVIEVKLEQAGFYPAGGGRFVVELEGGRAPAPVELTRRGELREREALALIANLPARVAKRELGVVRRELGWSRDECRVVELEGRGPGNALCLIVEAEAGAELVTGFGTKGARAELVAEQACAELRRWLDAEVPVGEHLADQLLIPMALAARGGHASVFVTTPPSRHTRTNAEIISRFLPVEFVFEALDERRTQVRAKLRG
ncbi:RNA 3'-terminal phosphate cyclase [Enhygromyxa salina]|uniref:RNA 3'-terminal phosphate cyclase n=1 Tax=Enhygromyxa salina TaxID=215803 RepID=A0A2S9YDJ0_9BACT|nr:RNA 3'-terminal phosphate cyclase [Enhygromyxa salina]PRQ03174.1 RNA 3'-terminal phosphate cyclase [Enhygromyxa salina]